MKILVTGGAGFIGSHTVVELINSGYTPIIIDNFSNSEEFIIDRIKKITNKTITFYNGNCSDEILLEKIFKKESDINGVIHFASFKAVGESIEKPLKYYNNNLNSTISILKIMKKYNIKNFIFSSSATIYGNTKENPISENSPIKKALNPYGHTKIIIEDIITSVTNSCQNLKAISLRYFNPIGAHPSGLIGELPLGIPNNLVPFMLKVAKKELSFLTIFGNNYNTPDGTCIRDYIHVVDLAKAHIAALDFITNNTKRGNYHDVFNVGTGTGTSVLEMIRIFKENNNIDIKYKIGPRRNGDIETCYANNHKIINTLKWRPKYTVSDALKHSWVWVNNINKN